MARRGKYIGLMSGTSADGIDAVLLETEGASLQLLGHHSHPFDDDLAQQIRQLCQPGANEIERLGRLDRHLGEAFAAAAQALLQQLGLKADSITAIGSHGQTVRHRPPSSSDTPFTLQIGDPNLIAELTGITTVADFRRRDLAVGGEGAPLVPAFHRAAFAGAGEDRVVVNIGGIANITRLSDGSGFDTGPGNTLLDHWIQQQLGQNYDADGRWAASGQVNPALLQHLYADPYFRQAPPKSTGREYFHGAWLAQHLQVLPKLPDADVQATLLELSARSIVDAVNRHASPCRGLYVCGGGARNRQLLTRLADLSPWPVASTASLGIDPQQVEAAAFAWLASQRLQHLPGNSPAATGARREVILGAIYPGSTNP